jgi:hypothetical protein
MKLRLTFIAMALSVLAISPVYAGGADGSCAYGSKYQQTSVEPQEQSQASKKLASLNLPLTELEKAGASPPSAAEKTAVQ